MTQATRQSFITSRTIAVQHIRISSGRPFAEVRRKLEGTVPKLDTGIAEVLQSGDQECAKIYEENDLEVFIAGEDAYYEFEINALNTVYEVFWIWKDVFARGWPGFDPAALPELLRAVFRAAGGEHDDWDSYDRAMRDERRAAVLLRADRIYSNRS